MRRKEKPSIFGVHFDREDKSFRLLVGRINRFKIRPFFICIRIAMFTYTVEHTKGRPCGYQ